MVSLEERVSYLEGRIDSLATKEDVERLGSELRGEMGELRGQIGELRGEFRGEVKALRTLMMAAIGLTGVALAGLNIILQLVG